MGAKKAERDADFNAFVTGAWPRLMRTAFLLTGDRYLAEDVVQTALERTYAAWGRVTKADEPYAYVRRIVINEHARRFRRRVPEQLVTAVPERSGPDGFARLDERAALLEALGTLPPGQRQAVVLRYWEDLSESQAAAAMGCSVGTVKSQASKGIAKLRELSSLITMTSIGGAA
ncbi:SigE family RNA polymerase sigma factor [Kitasatospora purpeofusca]|uniref:SigE family RNA polymerase sigma factor n=1 Tax=Kitasatospora purpeofusca TaxID=67352 RepID=UPI0022552888|nr:SigE family RNA polymerase sigma factor [Kitasatospora purpeofusca]MCX4753821.1 SigE family RNA polymerase sigma factor [Kitasatospora purpeofusca]WSR33296.1 SigE family RNA polymerase sigma factor [Kitasatospora purpeofusca]WSR41368.1 SigE family RNA polymerase sigma factor [Kitasatospora purpeofusca]